MPTQYQIEQRAGITDTEIAKYLMDGKTVAARNAIGLLKMQCDYYEENGFALLEEAVKECRREMSQSLTRQPNAGVRRWLITLEDTMNWQPIETAPKDGTSILVHIPSRLGYFSRQDICPVHWTGWGGGCWEISVTGHKCGAEPSHWMPLPPPPNPCA